MTNIQRTPHVGLWIIGALGDISSTLIAGSLAIKHGMASTTGMVSTLEPLSKLKLVSTDELIFGGLDVKSSSMSEAVDGVNRRSRTLPDGLKERISDKLKRIDEDLYINNMWQWCVLTPPPQGSPPLRELIQQHREAIREFKQKHQLDHVVVANLASAEALPDFTTDHNSLAGFENLLDNNRKDLVSPSMAATYTAFMEGCSYINFTPNPGAAIGALLELAEKQDLPHYGNDGKTGETLIKTALAPMFAMRNLQVMSWEGYNMLGNTDGKTLDDPNNRQSKLQNKGGVLDNILGYSPHSNVLINYVPSLGDWKTAWDLIHFKGFLGVPMTMQFTWQGCDSILAAPLVLDMVRLSEFAHRHSEKGPMRHLACFFKNPIGVEEMSLFVQFEQLIKYAHQHLERDKNISLLQSASQ
jgi:myo-inositol-1-phosphate synthase